MSHTKQSPSSSPSPSPIPKPIPTVSQLLLAPDNDDGTEDGDFGDDYNHPICQNGLLTDFG
ncbi:GL21008 [Drosophila persimilis]|uniref:GL21008 n=1 Tax=Drosophila persimilis TaxID=7234 RepID=B4H823_DROPE|nr:GL21008 [Drosophila persimilis]